MVRCFIGIFIPENLKPIILNLQNQLAKLPIKCKMVERENLHICLSFLGEIEEKQIGEISTKLDEICQRYEKFETEISGIKFIPNEKNFRVLALNVHSSLLETISKNIKNEIGGDVKPPHLTLCRVKQMQNKNEVVKKIKELNSNVGKFEVLSVHLIKSELRRTGPVYTDLHASKLSSRNF